MSQARGLLCAVGPSNAPSTSLHRDSCFYHLSDFLRTAGLRQNRMPQGAVATGEAGLRGPVAVDPSCLSCSDRHRPTLVQLGSSWVNKLSLYNASSPGNLSLFRRSTVEASAPGQTEAVTRLGLAQLGSADWARQAGARGLDHFLLLSPKITKWNLKFPPKLIKPKTIPL